MKWGIFALFSRTQQVKANMVYTTHPRQRFHFPAAWVCFENELKEAKEAGDRDKECSAYTNLGIAYKSLDDCIKADKCHHQQDLKRKWKQRLSKDCLRQPWQILSLSELFRTESNRLSSTDSLYRKRDWKQIFRRRHMWCPWQCVSLSR